MLKPRTSTNTLSISYETQLLEMHSPHSDWRIARSNYNYIAITITSTKTLLSETMKQFAREYSKSCSNSTLRASQRLILSVRTGLVEPDRSSWVPEPETLLKVLKKQLSVIISANYFIISESNLRSSPWGLQDISQSGYLRRHGKQGREG